MIHRLRFKIKGALPDFAAETIDFCCVFGYNGDILISGGKTMKLGKKIAAALLVIFVLLCVMSPALFSDIAVSCDVRRGMIPEGITVTEEISRGVRQLRYQNIDRYVENMRASGVSDEEISRKILFAIEGECVSETLPAEYLSEVLTYGEVTQTISYLRIARNGSYETLSGEEMTAVLKKESSFFGRLFSRGDSYYRLTVTAAQVPVPENCYDDRDRYSVISADIVTLKETAFRGDERAILGLTWNGALYDSDYSELVLSARRGRNGETVDIKRHTDGGRVNNTEKAKDRIAVAYDYGVRCEAKTSRKFFIWGDSVAEQYVRIRTLSQEKSCEISAYYTWEYPLVIANADGVRIDFPSYSVPMYWSHPMRVDEHR